MCAINPRNSSIAFIILPALSLSTVCTLFSVTSTAETSFPKLCRSLVLYVNARSQDLYTVKSLPSHWDVKLSILTGLMCSVNRAVCRTYVADTSINQTLNVCWDIIQSRYAHLQISGGLGFTFTVSWSLYYEKSLVFKWNIFSWFCQLLLQPLSCLW